MHTFISKYLCQKYLKKYLNKHIEPFQIPMPNFHQIQNSSMNIPKTILVLTVLTTTLAIDCSPGGVPCASGTCHFPSYIQGCSVYASSTACQECEYNYVKNGNVCTYAPPADNSDCCKTFLPSGECTECAAGLVLAEGKCTDRKIVGCLVRSKTGSCLNCALEYTLFGGQCIKKITGCTKVTSTGACQACDSKYDLIRGFCIPRQATDESCRYPWVKSFQGVCQIPGCASQYDFGCNQCQAGFRLLPDGACKEGAIDGCQKYALDGFCQTCRKPFFTEFSGFCLPMGCAKIGTDGKCTQCDNKRGFELTNDGYCRIANCLVSNERQCLVCDTGYIQAFGGCVKDEQRKVCTVCARNFYLSETGDCKPKQPGCVSYNRYKCSACEQNLYLTRDYQCVPREPGCIYKDGVCSECTFPYKRVKDNRCSIEGCSEFVATGCRTCRKPYILTNGGFCTFENCLEVTDGRCLSCSEGYAISHQGFCYKIDPYCKAYNFQGKCIECQLGYYGDKSGSGLICRQEKLGCNYVDSRCTSCRAPFEYNSKDQTCSIDGCLKYFLGGCSTCAAGYDLRYNTCKLPFCLISHKGHCAECDPNYILKSDGTCVNKDEFCWKYGPDGNCLECATDYYLSKLTGKCKLREPGCLYNDNDRCYACDKPFYFDGVRCQIYGCMKLVSKGCDQCFYPMEVTKNGLCSVVNCDRMEGAQCAACKAGFMISADGSCAREDPKCLVYGPRQCKKCVKGYRLDNSGVCQYADEHCWDFSQQGHCTNCDRLFFLNIHNKCEIKDSNCAAYSGGRCIECKNYFYLHRGLCYPNAKGCAKQANIRKCEKCESGYKLDDWVCTPQITKLTWDSVDMDFWSGESDENVAISKSVFSVGKTNKFNLDTAIAKGKGKVFYTTVIKGRKSFQVDDDNDADGWTPESSSKNQFIGVILDKLETFYALDIKYIRGNTLSRFAVEESDDGVTFSRVAELTVTKNIIGTVQTFYFTPVLARAMRIVVLEGVANIKFDFYYSNGESIYPSQPETYISTQTEYTVEETLRGQVFETKQSCVDKELCWSGLELCEARPIIGFSFVPKAGSKGTIESVAIRYSQDGVKFDCYLECKDVPLVNGVYRLNPRVVASKLRVYPSKWSGEPSFSVTFEY